MIDTAKECYKITTAIWKSFRADLSAVATIGSAEDAEWKAMCDRYERIAESAPKDIRGWASDMALVHIAELERRWRWK